MFIVHASHADSDKPLAALKIGECREPPFFTLKGIRGWKW